MFSFCPLGKFGYPPLRQPEPACTTSSAYLFTRLKGHIVTFINPEYEALSRNCECVRLGLVGHLFVLPTKSKISEILIPYLAVCLTSFSRKQLYSNTQHHDVSSTAQITANACKLVEYQKYSLWENLKCQKSEISRLPGLLVTGNGIYPAILGT